MCRFPFLRNPVSLFLALGEDGVDVGGAVALAQPLVLLAERPVHDLAALYDIIGVIPLIFLISTIPDTGERVIHL